MLVSEAAAIRRQILELRKDAPADSGARRISRDVMRAIANEREDAAAALRCGMSDIARNYEISPTSPQG